MMDTSGVTSSTATSAISSTASSAVIPTDPVLSQRFSGHRPLASGSRVPDTKTRTSFPTTGQSSHLPGTSSWPTSNVDSSSFWVMERETRPSTRSTDPVSRSGELAVSVEIPSQLVSRKRKHPPASSRGLAGKTRYSQDAAGYWGPAGKTPDSSNVASSSGLAGQTRSNLRKSSSWGLAGKTPDPANVASLPGLAGKTRTTTKSSSRVLAGKTRTTSSGDILLQNRFDALAADDDGKTDRDETDVSDSQESPSDTQLMHSCLVSSMSDVEFCEDSDNESLTPFTPAELEEMWQATPPFGSSDPNVALPNLNVTSADPDVTSPKLMQVTTATVFH